jgi:hypothetical protein
LEAISDQTRQREILSGIFRKATSDWGPNSMSQAGYILRLRGKMMNRLGLWSIDEPVHQPLLYITTYSGYGGRTAGLIAEDKGRYFLFHDGRTRKIGLPSPYSESEEEFFGNRYFRIGRIDESIFDSIISYHSSRLEAPSSNVPSAVAFSPGPKNAMGVPAHNKNLVARHYELCVALKALCLEHGWSLASRKTCTPDLAVEKGNLKLLFEVKPSGDFGEICAAIGQILVYNKEIRARETIIVSPEGEMVRRKVSPTLEELGIKWAGVDPSDLSRCTMLIDALKS